MIEYSEVGRIIDEPGTYNDEGNELTPPTYQDGWHVNMTELLPELTRFQIFPSSPVRVYSDAPTVFLRFGSEEEWAGLREALEVT